ncbi:MAG TPA: ABC transporter ATP-binding protein [Rhodospirillaceae bacterium]|jgi:capsular polysaccharide transport system ATP-binding protein|nr:ABC transporter ATP-binding protein [Alphaproteobacteria bacterium]HBH26452.1 ABC transporter ATP-binding protein [Rhodospirillaceae bacterium]
MIEIQNVSKAYCTRGAKTVVFDRLNLSIPRGRNLAIMGCNGAGKSTLMRLLSGAERPDSGRILRSASVSWPLGFAGGFNGSMTGVENVRFVSRVYGRDTDAVLDYVRDFAEIGHHLRLPMRTYSSGMRARLAFGLSLAIDFDCYLIDEAMSVGDARFRAKSKAAFADKMAKAGQVVMVSHSLGIIREYCNCGILLERGGKVAHFDDAESLIEAYKAHLEK